MEIFVNYDQRYGLDIPLIRYLLVKVENGKTDREVKKHGETSVRKPWIPFVATSFFLATQQPLTRVHTLVARFIILTHSFFRSHSHALSFRVCLFPSVCVCVFFFLLSIHAHLNYEFPYYCYDFLFFVIV